MSIRWSWFQFCPTLPDAPPSLARSTRYRIITQNHGSEYCLMKEDARVWKKFATTLNEKTRTKQTSFLLSASADRTRGLMRVVGDVWALLLCGLTLPSSGFNRVLTLLPYAIHIKRWTVKEITKQIGSLLQRVFNTATLIICRQCRMWPIATDVTQSTVYVLVCWVHMLFMDIWNFMSHWL